jgi:hypothetical protein
MQEQKTLAPSIMNLPTSAIKAILIEKYRWSEYAICARAKIKEISNFVSIP